MILLDTNVVSELMRPAPEPRVFGWFESIGNTPLALASMTVADLRHGIERLPEGRRRDDLGRRLALLLADQFGRRVLAFDAAAAAIYGTIAAAREGRGRSVEIADLVIAATALARGAELATRNTRHFEGSGLTLHDPWGA